MTRLSDFKKKTNPTLAELCIGINLADVPLLVAFANLEQAILDRIDLEEPELVKKSRIEHPVDSDRQHRFLITAGVNIRDEMYQDAIRFQNSERDRLRPLGVTY